MKIKIKFAEPFFSPEEVNSFKKDDLYFYYDESNVYEQFYLSFILETSALNFLEENDPISAARTYYLLASYLFHVLTPPGALELSVYYIQKAIVLSPTNEEYKEKLEYILEYGNV